MSDSPVQALEKSLSSHEFVMLVYYRGHWCPFCQSYLRSLQKLRPRIEGSGSGSSNGAVIAVTAEEAKHIPEMRQSSGYEGEIVSDPDNALADQLRREGLLDVAITEKAGYPHGMAQPAVLVLRKDRTPLYKWAIVPSTMNLGGAKDRPSLEQILDNALATIEGRKPVHGTIARQSFWQVMKEKIFG